MRASTITAAMGLFGMARLASADTPATLRDEAAALARTAQFGQAAEKLEQYARKYAGESDAVAALGMAIRYRTSLGEDAKAIADTRFFVSLYGAKSPQRAAEAVFALTRIYEKQRDTDAVIKNLREYIQRYGAIDGADRLVIAYAKLGAALWRQSCPRNELEGLCIRRDPPAGAQLRCDAHPHRRLTVIPRDPALVKQATAAFAAAIRELEKRNGKTDGDEAGARYFYAQARLARADGGFERYLADAPPETLDFDPAKFDRWLAQKLRLGTDASQAYERIFETKDMLTSLAAAARLGLIAQTLADSLVTSPIPPRARTAPARRDAYCGRINELVAPLEQRAAEMFRVCLERSSMLGWFDSSSARCEAELQWLTPGEFPLVHELHGRPRTAISPDDLEPPSPRDALQDAP